jgi:hypothetical protein
MAFTPTPIINRAGVSSENKLKKKSFLNLPIGVKES